MKVVKLKDIAINGDMIKGSQPPKPFHSILLYNLTNDYQYLYSNKIAIGEHDGICYQAYGKNVPEPEYWMYIDCE